MAQLLAIHHCKSGKLGWCSKLGSLCPSLEEGRQPLQEWLGDEKISNAPPKIGALPQHGAWRHCPDKSRGEWQHMANSLMPSGIFPAVFEELGSKCCFEGLSSEPIFNHVEFAGSLDGVDSAQHLPGTSLLSQKSFFKGLKVSSGTKARIRWEKKLRNANSLGQVKHTVFLAVDVTSKEVYGSRSCLQTSSCCCLNTLKCF